jgi:ABC-type Fe3+/spermidine/putrescine transport system ATPase subunit
LGPSGCGKTTLLSCIVGRSELDSGEIMVKALKREDIGYMPQVRNLVHYFLKSYPMGDKKENRYIIMRTVYMYGYC